MTNCQEDVCVIIIYVIRRGFKVHLESYLKEVIRSFIKFIDALLSGFSVLLLIAEA